MSDRLIVLGASVRALAFSALRAGFTPVCGDLFADADLRRAGEATRAACYPGDLVSIADRAPAGPWMYAGALENYPDLIDRISAKRQLLGNAGPVVRQVRDPLLVAGRLTSEGLPCPRAVPGDHSVPRDGSWLRKRRLGSGGGHVQPWDSEARQGGSHPADWYFQQRIEGTPCAGIFLAAAGDCVLLGVTRQLIAADWTHGNPWQYCGSIGPLTLPEHLRDGWLRIGECLSRVYGLTGLFGVDAVVNRDVWPVEINPRYTASVEVLERALEVQAVRWHVQACREAELPDFALRIPGRFHGKAILYARADFIAKPDVVRELLKRTHQSGWPDVADIPPAGTRIRAGQPVATVLADGETEEITRRRLQDSAARLETLFEQGIVQGVPVAATSPKFS